MKGKNTMETIIIERIASLCEQHRRCTSSWNSTWKERSCKELDAIEHMLPSGSGIDCGTKIDRDKSGFERVVLTCSFHHMDDCGGYDGWTDHTITVRPSFLGRFSVNVSGRDRNGIKDYLVEVYDYALRQAYDMGE